MTLHSLPLFVRLAGRPVILLGEGEAAEAKRRLLERAGAILVSEETEATLAIVALDDPDAAVVRLRARGILVNAVDRPDLCDFTLPAIVDRDPVIVSIGTGGVSAGLAAALRQRLEALLPADLGRLAERLHAMRAELRARYPDTAERRRAIADMLSEGGGLDPLTFHPGEGRGPAGMNVMAPTDVPQLGPGLRRGGVEMIRLVSPDPDDLTLRQARALANADRVTYRPDVPPAILDRARADAVRIACAGPPVDVPPGRNVDVEMRT